MLLVEPSGLPASAERVMVERLEQNAPVWLFGGPAALSELCATQADWVARGIHGGSALSGAGSIE